MTQWEYKKVKPGDIDGINVPVLAEDVDFGKVLKPITDKGWEIISLMDTIFIFKREIEDKDKTFETKG